MSRCSLWFLHMKMAVVLSSSISTFRARSTHCSSRTMLMERCEQLVSCRKTRDWPAKFCNIAWNQEGKSSAFRGQGRWRHRPRLRLHYETLSQTGCGDAAAPVDDKNLKNKDSTIFSWPQALVEKALRNLSSDGVLAKKEYSWPIPLTPKYWRLLSAPVFEISALVMLGEPGLAKTRLDTASSWPRSATTRPGLILTMLLVHLVFVVRRPGPIWRRDWKPIACNYLKNRNVILHIDRARAYKMHIPSVLHDNVIRNKKVMIKGKSTYIGPTTLHQGVPAYAPWGWPYTRK